MALWYSRLWGCMVVRVLRFQGFSGFEVLGFLRVLGFWVSQVLGFWVSQV